MPQSPLDRFRVQTQSPLDRFRIQPPDASPLDRFRQAAQPAFVGPPKPAHLELQSEIGPLEAERKELLQQRAALGRDTSMDLRSRESALQQIDERINELNRLASEAKSRQVESGERSGALERFGFGAADIALNRLGGGMTRAVEGFVNPVADRLTSMFSGLSPEEVAAAREEFQQRERGITQAAFEERLPPAVDATEVLTDMGAGAAAYAPLAIAAGPAGAAAARAAGARGAGPLARAAAQNVAEEAMILPATALDREGNIADTALDVTAGSILGTMLQRYGGRAINQFLQWKRELPADEALDRMLREGMDIEDAAQFMKLEDPLTGARVDADPLTRRTSVPTGELGASNRYEVPRPKQIPLFEQGVPRGEQGQLPMERSQVDFEEALGRATQPARTPAPEPEPGPAPVEEQLQAINDLLRESTDPAEQDWLLKQREQLLREAGIEEPVPPVEEMVEVYQGGDSGGFWTTDPQRAASYGPVKRATVTRSEFEAGRRAAQQQGQPTPQDTFLPHLTGEVDESIRPEVVELEDVGPTDLNEEARRAAKEMEGRPQEPEVSDETERLAAEFQSRMDARTAEKASTYSTEEAAVVRLFREAGEQGQTFSQAVKTVEEQLGPLPPELTKAGREEFIRAGRGEGPMKLLSKPSKTSTQLGNMFKQGEAAASYDDFVQRAASVGISERQAARLTRDPDMAARLVRAVMDTDPQTGQNLMRSLENIAQEAGDKVERSATFLEDMRDYLRRLGTKLHGNDGFIAVGQWAPQMADGERFMREAVRAAKEGKRSTPFHALFYNAMLSSPKTWLRNIVGNMSEVSARYGESVLRSGTPLAAVGGYRGTWQGVSNMYAAVINSFDYGLLAWRKGVPVDEMLNPSKGSAARVGEELTVARNRPWAVPSKILLATDGFFQGIAFHMEAYERAYLAARKAGHKWGTPEFEEAAERYLIDLRRNRTERDAVWFKAKEAVFRDYDKASDVFTRLRDQINQLPFSKELKNPSDPKLLEAMGLDPVKDQGIDFGIGLGDLMMPFIRTPFTIAKRSMQYNPIMFPYAALQRMKGDPRAGLTAARAAMGTAALASLYYVAQSGVITGDGTRLTSNQRAARERAGIPMQSIWDGKQWRSYNNLGPVTAIIGLAANMHEYDMGNPEYNPVDKASVFGIETAKGAFDASFLPNILDIVNGIMGGRGEAELANQIGRTAQPFALVNDLARRGDVQRQGVSDTFSGQVEEAIKQRTPLYRQTVPPRLSPLGEEIPLPGGFTGLLDPTNPRPGAVTPAEFLFQEQLDRPYPFSRELAGQNPDDMNEWFGQALDPQQRRQRDELVAMVRGALLESNVEDLPQDPNERALATERIIGRAGDVGGRLARAVRLGELSMEEARVIINEIRRGEQ